MMNVQQMNYAAICDCGVVRASMPVDYQRAKEAGARLRAELRLEFMTQEALEHVA